MQDFDALLAELAPLSKAMAPADGDEKVQAAAEEGGNDVADMGEDEGEGEKPVDEEEEGVLGKSFSVTLPDGSVQDAFDASELVKSFGTKLAEHEASFVHLGEDLGSARTELSKALTVASSLVEIVKGQDALIKSLRADVQRIGSQPTGRKAVVNLVEKPAGSAPTVSGPNPNEIMAKAMTANAAGTLMASDVARLEASFNSGLPAPADILARLPA